MKNISFVLLLFSIAFTACKEEDKTQEVQNQKARKQKSQVFKTINSGWNFSIRELSPESQAICNNWNQWRLFVIELNEKPKGTIGAFQRKTKTLVHKSEDLYKSIPERINKPQIKSRIQALITKVKTLHTFINLSQIPEKKVVLLISDLNIEVTAIQDQIEEIVRRGNIKLEEGESEMLNSIGGNQINSTKPLETLTIEEIK